MSEAQRLPVIAPASPGTRRVGIVSTFQRRRHIAVTACLQCRAKKRKCSGTSPCAACVSLGLECLLDVGRTGRRLLGAKRRLAEMKGKNLSLKRRVDSLENKIQVIQNHLPASVIPHVDLRRDSSPKTVPTNREVVVVEYQYCQTCVHEPSKEESVPDSFLEAVTDVASPSKEDWDILLALYQKVRDCAPQDLLKVVNAIRSSTSPRSAAEYLRQSSLSQLSDAHVGLANLATEYNLATSKRLPGLCEEPILSVPARLWTTVTSSDRLVSHLLSLYFTWDYPCYNWFDKNLFITDMIAGRPRFCSQLLVNALLAHACLYSYSLRRPWDRFKEMDMCIRFLSEAQRLRRADPRPSLTTVQAMLVMNLTYNCLGKDKVGWSCLATAIRMANELNLYEPPSPACGDGYDRPDPWNTARAATAWGLFEWQAIVAPVVHEAPRVRNAPFYDMPYSNCESLDHGCYWHPYPFREPVYSSSIFSTSRARLELSIIINDVTRFILDFPGQEPCLGIFLSLHSRLSDWLSGLNPVLRPSKDAPPHVFIMHLHYHLSVVGLCKPLLAPEMEANPPPSVGRLSENAQIATREIIFLFKQTFGWKSASNFLNHALFYGAFNAIPFAKSDYRWRRSLETCISGLWYISFSFPVCRYLLRTIQHALLAAGFVDTELSPEVAQILRYFTSKVWKKSLLKSLERFPDRLARVSELSAEETEELRGISLVTGIEMHLIVALGVLLDVLMGCTSGAADGAGRMLPFRTLDWGMDALRRMLVRFEYVQAPDETVLATSISSIGFVRVLTGVRRGLSVSLNFRPNHAGGWLGQLRCYGSQVLVVLGWRRSVSSMLREYVIFKDVLRESFWRRDLGWRSMEESQTSSWLTLRSICDELLCTPSTAAYLIICDGYEVTVIEKDHRIAFSDSSSPFIVATNSDHLTPALESKNKYAEMRFGTALGAGEVIMMADFLQDSKERRACMQARWDEKTAQTKRADRSSKKATAATRHDPLQRTRSSRLHEPKAPTVLPTTTPEETVIDAGETVEVIATLDEIIAWTASYPTTNEMTDFAMVLDPDEGRVLWIRRFAEPLVFEEEGD